MTLSAVGGQGECCLARHLGTTGPPAAPTARVGCHGLRTSTRRRPVQRPPTSALDNPGTCPPRPRRFLRGVVHGWPRRPAPGRSLPTRSPCHRLPAPQPVTRGGVEDYLANSAVDQAQVEAFEGFEVALRTPRGGNPDFSLDAVRFLLERAGWTEALRSFKLQALDHSGRQEVMSVAAQGRTGGGPIRHAIFRRFKGALNAAWTALPVFLGGTYTARRTGPRRHFCGPSGSMGVGERKGTREAVRWRR